MSQLLALASAALYGIADLSGGVATRRMDAWRVTAWSQILGVPLLAIGIAIVGGTGPRWQDLAFGALGGVFGVVGIVALYSALAAGTMSVISPITGALTALIPVVWGVASGEAISGVRWFGIALALGAIVLVAQDHADRRMSRRVLTLAIVASIGFAAFFIALAQTSEDAGMWPLAAGRAVSIPIALVVAASSVGVRAPGRGDLPILALAGNGDVAANIAILLALQTGPLGISVVLTSLYPAFTALAAMVVLGERPTRIQLLGIVLALVAAALLVA